MRLCSPFSNTSVIAANSHHHHSENKCPRHSLVAFLSCLAHFARAGEQPRGYEWTTDHLHAGVLDLSLEEMQQYDANRPLIKEHSSYGFG